MAASAVLGTLPWREEAGVVAALRAEADDAEADLLVSHGGRPSLDDVRCASR